MLVLDSEDEIAVLMDFCLQDVRRQGKNAIERFLDESPPAPNSDEMVLLQALRQAHFAVLEVQGAELGVGVRVHDLLRDEELFLVDVGFSRSTRVGMVMASRLMAPEGMWMTTGASLPMGVLAPARRARFLERLKTTFPGTDFRRLSPEQSSELAARIIRTCLEAGAAERVKYIDPGSRGGPVEGPALSPAVRRVGRNEPCPCGSGRKFKNCCGARR